MGLKIYIAPTNVTISELDSAADIRLLLKKIKTMNELYLLSY